MRRVVVTGLGTINPLGNTVINSWDALLSSQSGISKINKFDTEGYPCKIAASIADNEIDEKIVSTRDQRKIDRFIALGLVAAHEAVEDSGFVSEGEVERVVSSIKGQATFDHRKEISLEESSGINNSGGDLVSNNNDELYSKAVEIIIKQQKVSTSYIQRYLQIGYNRAARIIEKMEEEGIISEANNAGKRHVLKKE